LVGGGGGGSSKVMSARHMRGKVFDMRDEEDNSLTTEFLSSIMR
jgi:hypothetical protein